MISKRIHYNYFLYIDRKTQCCQTALLPKWIYRITLIPTKILAISFVEIDKLTLMEMQRT